MLGAYIDQLPLKQQSGN